VIFSCSGLRYDMAIMKLLRTVIIFLVLAQPGSAFAAPSENNAAPANPILEATISRGDILLAAGDNAAAERQYRAALQQAPAGEARADVLHKLGIALAHQNRFIEAEPLVAEAEKIARARPGGVLLADVLRAKTVILYRTNRIERARAAFREAKGILEGNAAVWSTAEDGTTWRHIPSGQNFAAAQGAFQRIRRTMLDDTGHNVVVHYRIGPSGWAATLVSVYITVDRDVPLPGEFAATRAEIIRQYPDAKVLDSGPAKIASSQGFGAVLDLPPAADGRVRRTSLHAFQRGNVLIRIRASYPAAEAETRTGQVKDLTRAILSP
jgi:tetratricopeptide (TPR) repeat protein